MLKALMKKQFLELFSMYFIDRRTGRARKPAGVAGFFAIFGCILYSFGQVFYSLAAQLADPLSRAGMGWLYFAYMGLMALGIGTFGSVFSTYSGLYRAKDNDLLLSMPIKPVYILTARLTGVYVLSIIYEGIVLVPAIMRYAQVAQPGVKSIIFSVLLIFILGFITMAVTCLSGRFIAFVVSKVSSKSFVTVAFSLLFVGIYYYCFFRVNTGIQKLLSTAGSAGGSIKKFAYPLYSFGKAAEGNTLQMLLFTLGSIAVFALTFFALSRSFIKLATADKGEKKKAYKEKSIRTSSASSALLSKELRHFISSPNYMLNCGFGILLMPVAAAVILIKPQIIHSIASANEVFAAMAPVFGTALVCLLQSMIDTGAPSVSLEGKSLWIVQSLPVPAEKIVFAKVKMQILLSVIPSVLLTSALAYTLKTGFAAFATMLTAVISFIILVAEINVSANLMRPNLSWTSEIAPIKQSIPVFLALFGGFILSILIIFGYYICQAFFTCTAYLLALTVIFAAADILLSLWLKNKGSRLFEEL